MSQRAEGIRTSPGPAFAGLATPPLRAKADCLSRTLRLVVASLCSSRLPTRQRSGRNWDSIATGGASAGIKADGSLWTWGWGTAEPVEVK